MQPYLTVAGAGVAEQIIERSRFIGYVHPAKTPEECESFFEEIRRRHRDATHNVPAYVLGAEASIQWAGDDGEPRGTSGAPMAHMLVHEGISDTAIMVTRYFGGVKLGTGGLVRAYTSTAKMAVNAAGLEEVSERLVIVVDSNYPIYERIAGNNSGLFTLGETIYTDTVHVELITKPEKREEVFAVLQAMAISPEDVSEEIRVARTLLK